MLTVEQKKAYMIGYTTATAQQFGGDNSLTVSQANSMAINILRELFDEFGFTVPSMHDYFKFFLEVDEIGKVLLKETRLK